MYSRVRTSASAESALAPPFVATMPAARKVPHSAYIHATPVCCPPVRVSFPVEQGGERSGTLPYMRGWWSCADDRTAQEKWHTGAVSKHTPDTKTVLVTRSGILPRPWLPLAHHGIALFLSFSSM